MFIPTTRYTCQRNIQRSSHSFQGRRADRKRMAVASSPGLGNSPFMRLADHLRLMRCESDPANCWHVSCGLITDAPGCGLSIHGNTAILLTMFCISHRSSRNLSPDVDGDLAPHPVSSIRLGGGYLNNREGQGSVDPKLASRNLRIVF